LIYVDSNYWIYWLDSRLPEHKYVSEFMRKAVRTGIIINNITLVEVGHYLRRLPKEEFLDRMSQIQNLSTLTLIDLDATVTDDAVEMLPEYSSKGLGGRDCIIIATMKLSRINRIATHDQDFRKVKGLRVVDPIPRAV